MCPHTGPHRNQNGSENEIVQTALRIFLLDPIIFHSRTMLRLGEHSYAGGDVKIRVWTRPNVVVQTGKFCSIAGCEFIIDGNHRKGTAALGLSSKQLGGKTHQPWEMMSGLEMA